MMKSLAQWKLIHKKYARAEWIQKPTLFAKFAIRYFPPHGAVLDLGAGQGQDSRFFATRGYRVVSTDFSPLAIKISKQKTPAPLSRRIAFKRVDLSRPLPFQSNIFEVVYAHLSLHYFDRATTFRLFKNIHRILKPGGVLAVLVNSIHDKEYGGGTRLGQDFYLIDGIAKKYFNPQTIAPFVWAFKTIIRDERGETYKDRAKGVHNLIRFIGIKK